MKAAAYVGILGVLVVVGAFGAHGQSLKLRQLEQKQEEALAADVERTNKTCAANFTVKFDWSAAPAAELEKYDAKGYCDNALRGIRRVCSDPAGREAVKQKIKSMTCGFGAERSISLEDGVLAYKINFTSVNDDDFAFEFLQNNL